MRDIDFSKYEKKYLEENPDEAKIIRNLNHERLKAGCKKWNAWAYKFICELEEFNKELLIDLSELSGENFDFTEYYFPCSTEFRNSKFEGNTNFTKAIFDCGQTVSNINFDGAIFNGNLILNEITVNAPVNQEVHGTFNLSNIEIKEDFQCNQATIESNFSCNIKENNNRRLISGKTEFINVTIMGGAYFRDIEFSDVEFKEVTFSKGVSFSQIIFTERAVFENITSRKISVSFGDKLVFKNYARFTLLRIINLSFTDIEFESDVEFNSLAGEEGGKISRYNMSSESLI